MELRHLKYFITVAEQLHFGRAAEILKIAQPPLSRQIQQLEQELGILLFERSKRQVRLTDAGQVLLERAYQIFEVVDDSVRQVQRAGGGEKGKITIGFVTTASYDVLPKILREYQLRYPDVEMELRELTTTKQIEALKKGELDVSFSRLPSDEKLLNKKTVLHETLIVAFPESHPFADKRKIHLSDLKNESFIIFPRHMGPNYYDEIIKLCIDSGFSPRIVQEAKHMHTTINLISSGIGLSIVPSSVRRLKRQGVVYRDLVEVTNGFEIAAIWKKDNSRAVVQNFISLLESI
ncbi:LysR family transcriptional regulator [Bacillus sp. 03113]|uniref:LysR family transcriptional regulator n=1 Tax=Bacillus sp. 03113 TaxID=2578211 RepID=UPI00114269F8|nr:LysR family transcriptional regulator [Bacillus sp. 03113]